MNNDFRFSLRHGDAAPNNGDLLPYELGYSDDNKALYIRAKDDIVISLPYEYEKLTNEHEKLTNAITNSYNLEAEVTGYASNYSAQSNTSVSATLYGNCLKCDLQNFTRNTNSGAGDITNEEVATIKITHGGKIKSVGTVSFNNGVTGPVATFWTKDISIGETEIVFHVWLAATSNELKTFNCSFILPVTLNIENF